jgi:hypothetical protein
LTREAVAEVAARPLVFDRRLYDQIADFFTRVGRPMGENNRKQAFLPEGAIPIENPVGTAPGFIVEHGTQAIASITGVPHEMRHFMEHAILPYLRQKMGIREIIVSRVLKLFGIGESLVDEKIKELIEEGKNPTIGLLLQIGGFCRPAKAEHAPDAQAMNSALERRVRERLEPFIFGTDDETYEGVLTRLLHDSGLTLAVAETGYGSSIIQTLKGLPGSDRFLKLGITLTTPAMGAALPGVPAGSLGDEAILGEAAARGLAQGVRAFAGADLGLALTGRAARDKPRTTSFRSPWSTPGYRSLEQRCRTRCASSKIARPRWPWPRLQTIWSEIGVVSVWAPAQAGVNGLRGRTRAPALAFHESSAPLLVWAQSASGQPATAPADGAVAAKGRSETGRERNRAT